MMSVPRSTSATASSSPRRIMEPVGLFGNGSISALVRGVIFALSASARSLNLSSSVMTIGTGVPPQTVIIGE